MGIIVLSCHVLWSSSTPSPIRWRNRWRWRIRRENNHVDQVATAHVYMSTFVDGLNWTVDQKMNARRRSQPGIFTATALLSHLTRWVSLPLFSFSLSTHLIATLEEVVASLQSKLRRGKNLFYLAQQSVGL